MVSRCRISYSNTEGTHTVEVSAETLFEAVAMAVVEFREDTAVTPPCETTDFTVMVLKKPVEHSIQLRRVQDWAQPSTKGGPAEAQRRERVRKMLAGRQDD